MRTKRRRRTGWIILWLVLLTVLAMVLAYAIVNGDLEPDLGALLGLQFGATSTQAPVVALITVTPTPTATLTPLVPTPSPLPVPTRTPTQEPAPSPTQRPTTTPVSIPTPNPAEYSIVDVNVKLSTSNEPTTAVDFTVSMRRLRIGADKNPVELLIAVDGGEAEMVAIIPGLTSRDTESFVFSREFSPGDYVATISIADATVEVPIEVPWGADKLVPPSATPAAIGLIASPLPTPTEIPTVTSTPIVKATPNPTIAPTPMPEPSVTPTSQVTAMTPRPTKTPAAKASVEETSPPKYPGDGPLDRNAVENWITLFTNEEREKAGLKPFIHDPLISDIARAHSENMVKFGYGHTVQGSGPTDRALAAGYDCRAYRDDGSYSYGLSENIFMHYRVTRWSGTGSTGGKVTWRPANFHIDSQAIGRGLVDGWMNSPGHRANILDSRARRIGVGVDISESSKYGWTNETVLATQNFSDCS